MPTTVTGGGSPAPTPTPITHTQPDGSTVITGWQYTCPRCGITTTSKAHPRTMGGRTPEHTCNPTGGGSTRMTTGYDYQTITVTTTTTTDTTARPTTGECDACETRSRRLTPMGYDREDGTRAIAMVCPRCAPEGGTRP